MKPNLLILMIMLSTISITASAQGYIRISPVSLGLQFFGASYEGVVNDKSSFVVGANYILGALDAKVQYRFYLKSEGAPDGLFIAPVARLITAKGVSLLQGGALIGYQILFAEDRFSADIGFGPGYFFGLGKELDSSGVFGRDIRSFWPVASFTVGYRLFE